MIRRSGYIFVLAALFVGTVYFLRAVGFWTLIGVTSTHGYLEMGLLFLVALFVLQHTLFAPYLEVFDIRRVETIDKRERAERSRREAEEMLAGYRARIEEARHRAVAERERMALAAEEAERAHVTRIRDEADGWYARDLSRIHAERDRAREDLLGSVEPLAEEILERILGNAIPAASR